MRNLLCLLLATAVIAPAAMAQTSKPFTTASGLVYESLKDGTGESPKATDTVKVHYKGTFLDGKEFDSSYKRCLLYTSPSPRDKRQSRMPSSA